MKFSTIALTVAALALPHIANANKMPEMSSEASSEALSLLLAKAPQMRVENSRISLPETISLMLNATAGGANNGGFSRVKNSCAYESTRLATCTLVSVQYFGAKKIIYAVDVNAKFDPSGRFEDSVEIAGIHGDSVIEISSSEE